MLESLRDRPIARLPDRLRFDGRILLLVDDADAMRRQLAGEDLPGDPALYPLRDDISTDEITPGWVCFHYDEKLGDFPYVGLRAGGEFPITPGSVRAARFVASVSGKRRGKGSSREQSPFAEKAAGIRLVIAENIERIYRQNCQNLGLLTSTDFGLVERIRRGEEIPLEEFLQGEDPITREILRHGGLFAFNVARLQGAIRVPEIETPARPMSLAEKILARHMRIGSGRTGVKAVRPGDAGFVECDLRFSHEYVTPMASSFFEEALGAEGRIADPQSVLFFRDHLTFLHQVISPEKKAQGLLDLADRLRARQEEFARRQGVRLHGEIPGGNGSEGICHSLVLQNYALPGQVIAGTDSHTPHSGAVGALAFGVGSTDIFNAWITRDVRVLSLIHISEPTRQRCVSGMPS
ncbi:MAG: aconitase family protein, partial [Candidatus Eisenbacteria bacterium]|nr:aconitase family protein [Candidatus Eisenbacteria bacterium]